MGMLFVHHSARMALFLVGATIVAGPVTAVVASAFTDPVLTWQETTKLLLPEGRRLTLLINSILLSGAAALMGMVLSWFIASYIWVCTRRQPALIIYAAIFIWFMALLPPFIHSYTWMAFGNSFGLSGLAASWWTQTMAWLPLCLSIVLIGFRSVDPDLIDAAQLVASPLQVLIRIMTPLLAPTLLAGGALVFLISLQEYSIPSLFQISTYSLEIFSDYSAFNQPIRALLLAVPLAVVSVIALLGTIPSFRHVSTVAPRQGRMQVAGFSLPLWFRMAQYGCLLILVMQMVLPLLMLVTTVGRWEKLIHSITASLPEIAFSLQTSLLSAVVSVVLSIIIIEAMNEKWQHIIMPLAAVSLCVPATLTGIGMIVLFNNSLLGSFYNSEWMPVVTAVSRFGPLAMLISMAHHRRQDRLLVEAAQMFSVSKRKLWWSVRLPLMLPGVIVAGMTVFLLSMGELSATLLVLPPGSNTLAVKTYNFLHYGASDAVAGLCLFLVVTGWVAGLTALTLLIKMR